MPEPGPTTRSSQTVEFLLADPMKPSGSADLEEKVLFRQIDLDDHGFNRVIQNTSVPTLTVYFPEPSSLNRTAVIICPGGGYGGVVIDREGYAVARWLRQHGVTAAVLKYRLPKPDTHAAGLPVCQTDALRAVSFVRDHAEEWGVSKNRIGIIGFSAGGHLAGSTAVFGSREDGSRPDFVALLYPVIAMDGPFVHEGTRQNLIGSNPSAERIAEFSLERRVRSDFPPFFLFHAKDDRAVPPENSQMLCTELIRCEVPVQCAFSETGGHGFSLGRGAGSARWKELFLNWLDSLTSTER